MLFNSFQFIIWYLPIVAVIFFFLAVRNRQGAALWLGVASLAFYSSWNYRDTVLLIISIGGNFWAGYWLANAPNQQRKLLLWLSIGVNLAILGYFKYTNFLVDSLAGILGKNIELAKIALPLGISFFTFTQIAYLVDSYRGKVKDFNFIHYLLFVTYFPHLVAGPVLHHQEMISQFQSKRMYRWNSRNLANGILIFTIGLAKKVILADGVVGYVTPVFDAAKHGTPLTWGDGWIGALAYTVQLYFDFSGYSDMAIGLSLLFGVKLPINFDSPYKATNIIEFWRRWHISLSNFLRDYLYIPLGGNRHGQGRRYLNLFITMLLGGLWHGAAWTFVLWGALHGIYLVINHGWQWFRTKILWQNPRTTSVWGRIASQSITFIVVVIAWVLFRAENIQSAELVLGAMFSWPISGSTGSFQAIENPLEALVWISTLLGIVWFAPNSQTILKLFKNRVDRIQLGFNSNLRTSRLSEATKLSIDSMPSWAKNYHNWHYFVTGLVIPNVLLLVMISESQKVKEFIYFNF
jgi:alginate O-acetyltransferase complex protein AlgI